MTNVGEGGINIEKVRIYIEKVWIKDENVELKKVARRGLQVCKAKKTYRIWNCFSTISTKILVNRSYFAICGEFLSANLCESPIFSPYTVIYLLFQLSWLLVPYLTINFGDFLCDLFVELPKFSQILVTSTVIIFVFLPLI